MRPLLLSHYTATSSIGVGLDTSLDTLRRQASGLTPCQFSNVDLETSIGKVTRCEQLALPKALAAFDCRNNRLSQLGLEQDQFRQAVEQAAAHWGRQRIGVFIGTSTSGIHETELAYRQRDPKSGALPAQLDYRSTHAIYAVAEFVRSALGLCGPAHAVSTACSSSAKTFRSAQHMIEAGWIDAAVVGGVDSLCLTALYGFNSLELLAPTPCRPYDVARNGISIGEAAAFALLTRVPTSLDSDAILLSGIGESSDAHHMSSPHPEGRGAYQAMQQALASAGLNADDIDYINLHGTATRSNDRAEGHAVAQIFGHSLPCSSTKGATGHTLGAAGGLEAVICALALRHGLMPGGVGTQTLDPEINLNYLLSNRQQPLKHVLSNAFGFGGSNCCLILSRAT